MSTGLDSLWEVSSRSPRGSCPYSGRATFSLASLSWSVCIGREGRHSLGRLIATKSRDRQQHMVRGGPLQLNHVGAHEREEGLAASEVDDGPLLVQPLGRKEKWCLPLDHVSFQHLLGAVDARVNHGLPKGFAPRVIAEHEHLLEAGVILDLVLRAEAELFDLSAVVLQGLCTHDRLGGATIHDGSETLLARQPNQSGPIIGDLHLVRRLCPLALDKADGPFPDAAPLPPLPWGQC